MSDRLPEGFFVLGGVILLWKFDIQLHSQADLAHLFSFLNSAIRFMWTPQANLVKIFYQKSTLVYNF